MGPLCPGLGPEQLASGRKPGKVPPQPLEVSSLAGLGWAGQVPLLSPQGQLAQAGAMLERQVGCDWTGWELASWPGEPQPSSESIPSLGKGEVGSSQQGAASPPHPTPTKSSTLSPPPHLILVHLLEGGFRLPASSRTDSPATLQPHLFCVNPAGWRLLSPILFPFSFLFFFFSPSFHSFLFFRVHRLVFSPPPGEGVVLFSPYPLAGSQQGWGAGWGASGGGGTLPRLGGVLALLPHWQELESRSWNLLALGPEHV